MINLGLGYIRIVPLVNTEKYLTLVLEKTMYKTNRFDLDKQISFKHNKTNGFWF